MLESADASIFYVHKARFKLTPVLNHSLRIMVYDILLATKWTIVVLTSSLESKSNISRLPTITSTEATDMPLSLSEDKPQPSQLPSGSDLQLFKDYSEKKDLIALNNLGWCYLKGLGVMRNEKLGLQCIKDAAALGNVNAKMNLLYCLVNKIGSAIGQDLDLKEIRRLVDEMLVLPNPHPRVQVIAGILHFREGYAEEGKSKQQVHFAKAQLNFRKAIDQDYTNGYYYQFLTSHVYEARSMLSMSHYLKMINDLEKNH